MKIITYLQQHLGFTRNEIRAILVLGAVFLVGLGVRWLHDVTSSRGDARYDYRRADSIFAARSRVYAASLHGVVAMPSAPVATQQRTIVEKRPVRLNAATATELEQLPGIGPATAAKILLYRRERGKFRSIEELLNVKGIGPKKLERIRARLLLD